MTLDEFVLNYPVRQPDGPDGCWLWAGGMCSAARGREPYGRMRWQGKSVYVHRVTYQIVHGPLPAWAVLVRRVDRCEHSLCCNPAHWVRKRRAEVMTIVARTGRSSRGPAHAAAVAAGRRRKSQKLTIEQVRAIRASDEPVSVLAARYGVHASMIYGIRRGAYWRESTPFSGLAR